MSCTGVGAEPTQFGDEMCLPNRRRRRTERAIVRALDSTKIGS